MKINPRLKLAIALATVALGYAAPGAFAQSTYPDKTSEKKEYLEKKLTSQHFVRKAAIDGVKELRLAELGSASAVTPEVKGYASRLASEQQQANERLAAIAEKKGYKIPTTNDLDYSSPYGVASSHAIQNGVARADKYPETVEDPAHPAPPNKGVNAPQKGDDEHDALMELQGLTGAEFEKAFLKEMVNIHRKDFQLFTKASQELDDEELKVYAAANLPIIRDHLRDAQRLSKQLVAAR